MILLIDNYDSFTYNIYQYLSELGADVEVVRNDKITLDDIEAMAPDGIVISPGPCTPKEAGISGDVVLRYGEKTTYLGSLSGTSDYRFCLRRHRGCRRGDNARQDLNDLPRRQRDLPGSPQSL